MPGVDAAFDSGGHAAARRRPRLAHLPAAGAGPPPCSLLPRAPRCCAGGATRGPVAPFPFTPGVAAQQGGGTGNQHYFFSLFFLAPPYRRGRRHREPRSVRPTALRSPSTHQPCWDFPRAHPPHGDQLRSQVGSPPSSPSCSQPLAGRALSPVQETWRGCAASVCRRSGLASARSASNTRSLRPGFAS